VGWGEGGCCSGASGPEHCERLLQHTERLMLLQQHHSRCMWPPGWGPPLPLSPPRQLYADSRHTAQRYSPAC
jgi:hypothetical protein